MREYRDYLQADDARPPLWLGLNSITHILIVANVAIYFLFIVAAYLVLPYAARINAVTAVQTVLNAVGVVPDRALGSGWVWQLVTYCFFYRPDDALHLLFSMLTLYFFGREIETLYGTRRFLFLYFGAALASALVYCINWGAQVPLVSPAGSVFAIMVAYAFHYPRQRILFFFVIPLEVWFVVAILIGLDLAMQVTGGSYAPLAHLAGAFFGFLFYRFESRVERLFDRVERRMQRADRESDEAMEARLDTLLEKISKDGIQSLSKKERDFLKRASRHYQKKP